MHEARMKDLSEAAQTDMGEEELHILRETITHNEKKDVIAHDRTYAPKERDNPQW